MRKILPALLLLVAPLAAHAQPRPFGNVTLQELIGNLIQATIGLIGTLSLAMFVWGGLLWMTAQGNDTQVKKAKSILLYSSLGILATFMSYAAVFFVLSSIQNVAS